VYAIQYTTLKSRKAVGKLLRETLSIERARRLLASTSTVTVYCCRGRPSPQRPQFSRYSIPHNALIYGKQEAKVIWRRLYRIPLHQAVGDRDPRLTQCSLGLRGCLPQTGSRSVQPFSHGEAELSRVTDRPTDRRTDSANIGNNSLHLVHSMQPKSLGPTYNKSYELLRQWFLTLFTAGIP